MVCAQMLGNIRVATQIVAPQKFPAPKSNSNNNFVKYETRLTL
jgi:hypothetical protein